MLAQADRARKSAPAARGTSPVYPGTMRISASEVFAAQCGFLLAALVPFTVAEVTSVSSLGPAMITGIATIGFAAVLSAVAGTTGNPAAWAVVVATLDLAGCVVLDANAPIADFGVLMTLPVAWVAMHLGTLACRLTTAFAVAGCAVVGLWRVAASDIGWGGALPGTINLALLMVLTAYVVSLWTRRSRTQLRILESQSRRVGAALELTHLQERLLSDVLDSVDFAVVGLSADDVPTTNRAAEVLARRVGGRDGVEVLSHGPWFAEDGVSPVPAHEAPLALLRQGKELRDVLLHVGPPGPSQIPLRLTTQVLRPAGGRDFLVLLARDISEDVAAAREREEAVASVSHEIRTPLTSVLGYLELALEDRRLPDDVRAMLAVALDNTERMMDISGDFLAALSRRPQDLDLMPTVFRLADLVEEAVLGFRPQAVERQIALTLEADSRARVEADPLRVRQVLDNLLSNAVKYNAYDGLVEVRVLDDGPDVVVRVRDTGVGMSQAEVDRLFTAYYRSERARRSSVQGSGLGLSYSYEVVRKHGGRLWADSTPGRGTTMTLTLPRLVADRAEQPA